MTLICGTDFSGEALHAIAAATALSSRLEVRDLWLVHVLDPALRGLDAATHEQAQASAEQRLHDLVRDVQARTTCRVHARVLHGAASDTLVRWAEEQHATALVLASQGYSGSPFYRLGGTSERVAFTARVPVLIVRDPRPFEAWARGERALRILLGVDWTASSDPPIRWVKRLCQAGPCEVCVAHVYYASEARSRYGLPHSVSMVDPDPEVERLLTRDLATRVGDLGGAGEVTFRAALGMGRLGDHLLEVAESERVDMVVTGTHQRRGVARLGSIASVALHYSHAAVACVPVSSTQATLPEDIPPLRRVLISTDLSDVANAAIPYGYALLRHGGGEVWLVHILPEQKLAAEAQKRAEIVAHLRRLVPAAAGEARIVTRTEVVQSRDVAGAICQTAERLAADAICMASHGRTGVMRSLLGSVAEGVMRQTPRPTFIIHPPPA